MLNNKNLPGLFHRFFQDNLPSLPGILEELLGAGGQIPRIELRENGDEIILSAAVPGFDPRDLEITVLSDTVILKGDTRQEETRDGDDYYFTSHSRHCFYQEVPLPERVKCEHTVASSTDGVLEVKMVKGRSFIRGFRPLVS
jgi:HSP20 family molecular chaperone IbpA